MDEKLKIDTVSKILDIFSNLNYAEQVEIFKTVQHELSALRNRKADEQLMKAAECKEIVELLYAGNRVINNEKQDSVAASKPSNY